MSRYPADLDDETNLPNPAGYLQNGMDAAGVFNPAAVHTAILRVLQLGSRALQNKLGRGASVPAADRVLRGTAPGVSEWTALSALPATKLGVGAGQPGQALAVDAAGQVLGWASVVAGNDPRLSDTRTPTDGSVTDAKVAPAAAIAKSKLAPLAIVNADVDAAAAIAKSKLAPLAIVNTDVDAAAAIAKSKLAPLAIVNADVDAAAAIAESKLSLASDAAAGTASRRTLGTGATQALPGTHAGETGAGKHVAQQPAIASLALAVSDPPTQAQVQAIANKVDDVLAALRAAGVLA